MNYGLRINLAAIALLLAGSFAAYGEWVYFNVDELIPDDDVGGLQSVQTLSGFEDGAVISSIEVSLKIVGTPDAYSGDYYVSLLGPYGGFSVLLNRAGKTAASTLGYGDNGFDVVFTAGSPDIHNYQDENPVYDTNYLLTGSWAADGRNVDPENVVDTDDRTAGLDVFNGEDPSGDWTLFVADMNLNGSGTLESWGVNIAAVPEPAVISLLALFGGSMLFFRRFF